jgi:hypothetical protein
LSGDRSAADSETAVEAAILASGVGPARCEKVSSHLHPQGPMPRPQICIRLLYIYVLIFYHNVRNS